MKKERYSVIIQWSEEDQVFVVTLPEWGCHTHGTTYEEAAKNAREVLEMLIEGEEAAGQGLPPSHGFMYPGPSGFTYDLNPSASAIARPRENPDSLPPGKDVPKRNLRKQFRVSPVDKLRTKQGSN